MSRNRRSKKITVEHGWGHEDNYSVLIESGDVIKLIVINKENGEVVLKELFDSTMFRDIAKLILNEHHDPYSLSTEEHELLENWYNN